jgi:hypothetical protein
LTANAVMRANPDSVCFDNANSPISFIESIQSVLLEALLWVYSAWGRDWLTMLGLVHVSAEHSKGD